MAKHFSLPNLK